MKSLNRILWGLVFVATGTIFALKALDIISFDFFRDGWWTLIIIIPCIITLFTQSNKTASLVGILVGVVIFLGCRDIITLSMIWKLLVPAVIVLIGLSLIFGDAFNKKSRAAINKINSEGLPVKECTATFSSQDVSVGGEEFYGADLTSVFGSLTCDLRGAYFPGNAVINVSVIFGGMDIYLPQDINVQITATPIFGGISDKRIVRSVPGAPTVVINGSCIFGGVDIK